MPQKVSQFVAKAATGSTGARQPGSHLALVHMVSQQARECRRRGQALGRPDHLKSVWQETRAWALSEEARQHILTAGDVLVDFEDRLEGSHCSQAGRGDGRHAGQDRPGRAGRHETEERQLDKQQEAERQVPGEAPGQMRPQEQSLPADSQPLTGEGERAWRLWDVLLQHTASPKPDQSLPVADPEEWARHRQETVITMSDQIPAWLKPSPGKVVTSVLRLKLAREQGKLRAAARKGSTAKAKAKARPREESQLCRETTGPGP